MWRFCGRVMTLFTIAALSLSAIACSNDPPPKSPADAGSAKGIELAPGPSTGSKTSTSSQPATEHKSSGF